MQKPKIYAWNVGALAEFAIVGMNHYHASGVRCLFVAMSKDGRLIKAEGPNETEVFSELTRQANADVIPLSIAPPGKPDDPIAKSLADLVTPKQLGFIRTEVRQRYNVEGDSSDVSLKADELCSAELLCKTEELSKYAASYFISFLRGETQGESEPATEVQKGDVTTRKLYLRKLREFTDDDLRKEVAAVGCNVPLEIKFGQCARLIQRLDALILEAEKAQKEEAK